MSHFFAVILTAIASWFGHAPAAQTASSTPLLNASSSVSVQQHAMLALSDKAAIQALIASAIAAERGAKTFQDFENAAGQYYSAAAKAKLDAGIAALPASTRAMVETTVVAFSQHLPDPAKVHFDITIQGDTAVAVASMPDTAQATSDGTITTSGNSVTVNLAKESGQWKVVSVGLNSNGTFAK